MNLPVVWRWTDELDVEHEVPYLSPSQLWRYETCSECYRLEYVEKEPKIGKPALLVGGAFHYGIQRRRERWLDFGAGYDEDGRLRLENDPLERLEDDVEQAVSYLEQDLKDCWEHAEWQDARAHIDVIEWNRKTPSEDAAKDQVASLVRMAIPALAEADPWWGLEGSELRVWGLGPPLDTDEAAWAKGPADHTYPPRPGREPIFPFGVAAFMDAFYRRGVIGDTKTTGSSQVPGFFQLLQLGTYDLPWWRAGRSHRLRIDQFTKAKTPKYTPFWCLIDRQHVVDRYLAVAQDISQGRFRAFPNWWCSYEHGLHNSERSAA